MCNFVPRICISAGCVNSASRTFAEYVNGVWARSHVSYANDFVPGTIMAVGCYPYADGVNAVQGWKGEIALSRIYDEVFTPAQIITRYNELQSTIDALN